MPDEEGSLGWRKPDPIHTIPVPRGWSVEQAWEAIQRGEKLPPDLPVTWTHVDDKGRKLRTS